MSETALTSFATSALRRCSPQFQVISLITIFLSVFVSTVYIVHLALYAPLERVVILLALGYAGWQMQHASSVHQLPAVYSEPSVLLNTSSEPDLPAYTPKSTDSSRSDDSDDSDASDASLPTVPPVSLSNPAQGPSPTYPSDSSSIKSSCGSSTASRTSSQAVSPISVMSDTSTEPYDLPPLIYDDDCEAYVNAIVGCPPPKDIVPRSLIYTSFDKLPTNGYIKPVRLVNESTDGIVEWEFPHQYVDYRIQVTASEALALFEDAVKRPP